MDKNVTQSLIVVAIVVVGVVIGLVVGKAAGTVVIVLFVIGAGLRALAVAVRRRGADHQRR